MQGSNLSYGLDFDGDPLQGQYPAPQVDDDNIHFLAESMINVSRSRAAHYRTPHILLPFGCDFRWRDASVNWGNMDKLFDYIRGHPTLSQGINFQYGTLSHFMDAVKSYVPKNATDAIPTKGPHIDFLPYDTCWYDPDFSGYGSCIGYWSGYYSSRPIIKKATRVASDSIRVLDQLIALTDLKKSSDSPDRTAAIEANEVYQRANGLAQHHDAITGTMKPPVLVDYMERLANGESLASASIEKLLQTYLSKEGGGHTLRAATPSNMDGPLCDGCVRPIVVYNSLAWTRHRVLWVGSSSSAVKVEDHFGADIETEVVVAPDADALPYRVYFRVEVGPLSAVTLFVTPDDQVSPGVWYNPISDYESITNGQVTAMFRKNDDGAYFLSSMMTPEFSTPQPVQQSFRFYTSQGDGAYTFRPTNETAEIVTPVNVTTWAYRGRIVSSVRQQLTSLISHSVSVYPEADEDMGDVVHVEMTNLGVTEVEELVTRFDTQGAIDTNQTFWTENGMEMMKREVTYRLGDDFLWNARAGNFYPLLSTAYIQDARSRLSVLSDQTFAVSMAVDGSLETMLHRRSITDDGRGLVDPLNDTALVNISLYLTLTTPKRGEKMWCMLRSSVRALCGGCMHHASCCGDLVQGDETRHRQSLQLNHPLHVFCGDAMPASDWLKTMRPTARGLTRDLPDRVHLLTLSPRDRDSAVVRLQHLHSVDERAGGTPVHVDDISSLFTDATLDSLRVHQLTLLDTQDSTSLSGSFDLHPLELKTITYARASTPFWKTKTFLAIVLGSAFGVAAVVAIGPGTLKRTSHIAGVVVHWRIKATRLAEPHETKPLLYQQ